MQIVNLLIEFELPHIETLEGRRKVVNSIKERLSKLNVSVMDISSEYPKSASIAAVFLSPDSAKSDEKIKRIEHLLERYYSDIDFDIGYEIL